MLLAELLAPPPPSRDPEEVRELVEQVLARDEFQPASETLVERIARWLSELFGGDGGSTTPAGPPGSGGSAVFTILLFVAAVVALVLLARALLRGPRRRKVPTEPEPEPELEVARTVDEWADAAARHEGAGEWKEGLRCRFRALVTRLTERGVVPEVPGRTSGELRGDVRATAPAVGADFDEAATLFERAWYGDLPTGPEEAHRFARHAERVLATAGAVPVGSPGGEP